MNDIRKVIPNANEGTAIKHKRAARQFSTKEKILKEATKLFCEQGYAASTLRELARRSGVKGASIYHHFPSKQAILFQIMDETMSTLLQKLGEKVDQDINPQEKLRRAVSIHIEYHILFPEETAVTDSELHSLEGENYQTIVTKRDIYEKLFLRILTEGIEQKLFKLENVKLTCIALLQMCTGVSYWFKVDGPLTIHEVVDRYLEFICWGVQGKADHH